MKYSLKYRIQVTYWKYFCRWKYEIAIQVRKAFESMSKEMKDLLIKTVTKGIKTN